MIKIQDVWADCHKSAAQAIADNALNKGLHILATPKYAKYITKTILSQTRDVAKAIYLDENEKIVAYSITYFKIDELPKIGEVIYDDFFIDWKENFDIPE